MMAVSESDTASKAQGLFETVQQGTVALNPVCFGDNKGVAGFEYLPPELNTDPGFSAVACVEESFHKKESFLALHSNKYVLESSSNSCCLSLYQYSPTSSSDY